MANPYEYHNDQLGVQSRFLTKGKNMHEESIQVIGERGLQHRISNGYIIKLRAQGPNQHALVKWISLPPAWQRMLIDTFGEPAKKVQQSWFEKHYRRDTVAQEYYMAYRLGDGRTLPDDVVDEYTINASVLNAAEKIYNNRYALRRSMRGQVVDVWSIVAAECNRFRDIQPHTLPMNAASLRRKLREYKKQGYDNLIHKNYCNVNSRKVDESTEALLNNLFGTQAHKPTPTEVARQYDAFLDGYIEVINNKSGEIYDPASFKPLSKNTITNYLAKWVNKVGTHTLRSGDRQKWMTRFQPHHSMDAPKMSGSIISIDDRQPPFMMDNGKRLWFYIGADLASQAITTWVHGHTKEGIILDFYRQMLRNYTEWGLKLPAELEAESALNSSYKNSFLAPGAMFQHVRIEANNARAKRIERINRVLRYDYEKQFPGWRARPDAKSEANEIGPGKQITLPYEQVVEQSLQAIWQYNNSEHPDYPGKSRWDIFIEKQNPELAETNWRAILPALGFKTETSCNNGYIKLQNAEFCLADNGKIAYSDKLIKLLGRVEGKELDVYWLDNNGGKVMKALVYLKGTDTYVCEAMYKPRYNRAIVEQTPTDLANREATSKYVASVQAFVTRRSHEIDTVTVIDSKPKVLNTNFQMPGLRQPVDPFKVPAEPAEALPELPEENDFNTVETSFNRSLNERF